MPSITQLQAKLMKDYYKDFSKYAKGKPPTKKVAWVTAFAPVEILEALDVLYFYPESYAAVIAASGKEQSMLEESDKQSLCLDCCSYSCCFEGSLAKGDAPRGTPPKPDVLIATNNQCNTLPNWWNILAQRYEVPIIVLDYPGEQMDGHAAFEYVATQHKLLIKQMEDLTGNCFDYTRLTELLDNSQRSVEAWNRISDIFSQRALPPTLLFDGISFLITSRCKPEVAELYELQAAEFSAFPVANSSQIALFWLGYPLWYHSKRFFLELLDNVRICGSNYITWWSLDYSGSDPLRRLYNAYNFTFLNLSQRTKARLLSNCIENSGAIGSITLRNKSCKCDFVSSKNVGLPQVEVEIDMIDRKFLDTSRAERLIKQLMESVCEV